MDYSKYDESYLTQSMSSKVLNFSSPRQLNQLYCGRDTNLIRVEKAFQVKLVARENWLQVDGSNNAIEQTEALFRLLENGRNQGIKIGNSDFSHILEAIERGEGEEMRDVFENPLQIKFKRASIVPKTINQKRYLQFINKNDVVLGIGPAGTGKTYLAVAAALKALQNNEVNRVVLTRPAVEAGEALGFLPGDLQEKLLPYLRPLYDAMHDMLGPEDTNKLMERGLIEIAPLAYMRGRTLSNAYIILDEAQNTSPEQMMMFLTRLGDESKMIITGDITQVDLPRAKRSGLKQAVTILSKIEGIKLFYFEHADIVRHPLVSQIIQAYEKHAMERDGKL